MMPAEILTRMNAALTENNEQGMFVTMFIGLVDLNTGHLDFCNAGHNPPVILPKGEFIDVLPNAPVGLWPGLEYEGESIDNIKGRPLFLYSDGLNEAENRAQKQFGDDHLLHLLSNTEFSSARQTVEEIEEEVEKFRDGAEPNDDLTMMGISIK
jgi:serine phosphatase RsbU (regulator of sigma subunit)